MNFTPPRQHRHEILDDPGVDPAITCRSMRDVARANWLFGGTRAAVREIDRVMGRSGGSPSLLDVGSGLGDIPAKVRQHVARQGIALRTWALDSSFALTRIAKREVDGAICANALDLPLRDGSVDIVLCSQILHHFRQPEAERFIREMHRVSRRFVVIADLRRSWFAAGSLWLASFPLAFHPVSRHDGVVSILRGFTTADLSVLIQNAVGRTPHVATHPMFRITASWAKE